MTAEVNVNQQTEVVHPHQLIHNKTVLNQVAKAIYEMDRASFIRPQKGVDAVDWVAARERLFAILDRNGYTFCKPKSSRIRKKRKGE